MCLLSRVGTFNDLIYKLLWKWNDFFNNIYNIQRKHHYSYRANPERPPTPCWHDFFGFLDLYRIWHTIRYMYIYSLAFYAIFSRVLR